MKLFAYMLAVALSISVAGCTYILGPVKTAQALTDAKTRVIDDFAKSVENNPTLAGVADARKKFETAKPELTAKRDELKAAPEGLNVDWSNEFNAMDDRQMKQLDGVKIKLLAACRESCEEVKTNWTSLEKDFKDAVNRY